MVRREKSNYVIQSVSHALDVLEQFNGNVDEIGVTELSKRGARLHRTEQDLGKLSPGAQVSAARANVHSSDGFVVAGPRNS